MVLGAKTQGPKLPPKLSQEISAGLVWFQEACHPHQSGGWRQALRGLRKPQEPCPEIWGVPSEVTRPSLCNHTPKGEAAHRPRASTTW